MKRFLLPLVLIGLLALASCGSPPRPTEFEQTTRIPAQPIPTAVPTPSLPPAATGAPLPATTGVLQVQPRFGDGSAPKDIWIDVYRQIQDANGNPLLGEQVGSQYLEDTGSVSFSLDPGIYAVQFSTSGYPWPETLNHEVRAGETTTVQLALARMTLVLRRADGSLITGQWVDVYLQKQDANGQVILGDQAMSQYIPDTGIVTFDLTPGVYALQTSMSGYPWPDFQLNHALTGGTVTELTYTLGRISVTLRKADGSVASGVWVDVYAQRYDANGSPIRGDSLANVYVDDTGIGNLDLTPGTYMIAAGDKSVNDVRLEEGQIVSLDLTIQ